MVWQIGGGDEIYDGDVRGAVAGDDDDNEEDDDNSNNNNDDDDDSDDAAFDDYIGTFGLFVIAHLFSNFLNRSCLENLWKYK